MRIEFPSAGFDDAVAAVCHGTASDQQLAALHAVLRESAAARDAYILALELHARLASDPDLFLPEEMGTPDRAPAAPALATGPARRRGWWKPALAAAAAIVLVGVGVGLRRLVQPPPAPATAITTAAATSRAVAMLEQAVEAHWRGDSEHLRLGAPLEPGWLRLESGGAQVVFYNGARLSLEGPAELELVSADHAVVHRGKVMVVVPPQAQGFRLGTPVGEISAIAGEIGLEVGGGLGLHVFRGQALLASRASGRPAVLAEGTGAIFDRAGGNLPVAVDRVAFAALLGMQARSSAESAVRLANWRAAGERLNHDPSLLARFDFDASGASPWQISNLAAHQLGEADAAVVGCRWGEGRWPGKRAIEFQSVNDRVRLSLPGEFPALTLSTWVRVHGLDRELNSLFMSDDFEPGTIHWLIRNDGVLGLTIVGRDPGRYQISTTAPVLSLDRFGMWVHLAAVVDGRARRIAHYVDGRLVGESALHVAPPYRIGPSELGNWNTKVFPKDEPFMIRNFSGAMDEFCVFARALTPPEIESLHAAGRPDAHPSESALAANAEP